MTSRAKPYNAPQRRKPATRQEKAVVKKPKGAQPTIGEQGDVKLFEALTEFTLFPKLPAELRLRVWHLTVEKRFIGFKFNKSRFPFPAIYHVNKESRYEAKNHIWSLHLPQWGIIANPSLDILHLDSTSFSNRANYHIDAVHSIMCHGSCDMIAVEKFTTVSISLKELLKIWRNECLHCFFKRRFSPVFPKLKEINVMLRPGLPHTEPSDMWVVDGNDISIDYHQTVIEDIKAIWKRVVDDTPKLEKVTFQFVRVERWAQ